MTKTDSMTPKTKPKTNEPMTERLRRVLLAAFCLVCGGLALALGGTYGARLSDHRGFLLVPVEDYVRTAAPHPRRTVLVVFDGLGRDDAATMPTLQGLAREWPCLDMDVGAITFSRPSYAEISTGLESDRTGCRGNAETAPLAAESIWEVARQAGREIHVVSDLTWWHELFPNGVPDYAVTKTEEDYFAPVHLAEVTLIHPMYVDDAGHQHGVHSTEFQGALQRGDRELSGLLKTLDFSRDLLIVTGDHGHAIRGGHGGREDRIAHVTTCFAGPGVLHGPQHAQVSSTTIAPAFALLSGLRFPHHMRASSDGYDDLDAVMALADPQAFPPDYLADRRAAIARFRGSNPAWAGIYGGERQKQTAGMFLALLIVMVVLAVAQRHRPRTDAITSLCFTVGLFFVTLGALAVVHRGFDLSAIVGTTAAFVRLTIVTCLGVAGFAVALHLWLRKDVRALATDLCVLSAAGLVLALAEPLIFGYRMGFPLPSAHLLFFPIMQTTMLLVHGLFGAVFGLIAARSIEKPIRSEARATPAPSS